MAHVPFGAHPSPVQGYYNRDNGYYGEYHEATRTRADFQAWLGEARLDSLKVRKHAWSARADFGN